MWFNTKHGNELRSLYTRCLRWCNGNVALLRSQFRALESRSRRSYQWTLTRIEPHRETPCPCHISPLVEAERRTETSRRCHQVCYFGCSSRYARFGACNRSMWVPFLHATSRWPPLSMRRAREWRTEKMIVRKENKTTQLNKRLICVLERDSNQIQASVPLPWKWENAIVEFFSRIKSIDSRVSVLIQCKLCQCVTVPFF